MTKQYFTVFFLSLIAVSACAASEERKVRDQSEQDAGSLDPVDGGEGEGTKALDGSSETSADANSGLPVDVCGNGRVEGDEECDDGNLDSRDGCTTSCEFSCITDEDCDDLNDCNGVDVCTPQGVCVDSDPNREQGEACGEPGENKSCWKGACVLNTCGDGTKNAGETCDDGNLDPNNGCTPDCELTCEDDNDCNVEDPCRTDRKCEDDGRHNGLKICTEGIERDDRTACEITDTKTKSYCGDPDIAKDGWCISGVCTCPKCGDGETDDDEECDDGELNGTDESPSSCSITCRVVRCQNGVVEGDEECDDGNDLRLDGCDPDCKYEFAHRFTSLQILKDVDIPKWCKYQNNRF